MSHNHTTSSPRRCSRVRFSHEECQPTRSADAPHVSRFPPEGESSIRHSDARITEPSSVQPHFRHQTSHLISGQTGQHFLPAYQSEPISPRNVMYTTSLANMGSRDSSAQPPSPGPPLPAIVRSGPRRAADIEPLHHRDSQATLTDATVNAKVGEGQHLGLMEKSNFDCSCYNAPDVAARPPLKASERLIDLEEEGDPSTEAAREAASLVTSHTQLGITSRTPQQPHPTPHRPQRMQVAGHQNSEHQIVRDGYDWSDPDEEARLSTPQHEKRTGVLSNLLKLSSTKLGRTATASSCASATSIATSRVPSQDDGSDLRQRRRRDSDISVTSVYPFEAAKANRDGKEGSQLHMQRCTSTVAPWNAANDEREAAGPLKRKKQTSRKLRRLSITVHVTDLLLRHKFILKLAKALMTFGAPSHRIESQLNAIADILDVDGHFVHLPSIVIASFGDPETHTTETHFVKAGGGLNLGSLTEVHEIFRQVAHDEIGVDLGIQHLTRLLNAKPVYGLWTRILIATICAGSICMLGFSGSFVDGLISAIFGGILAFLQIRVAASNPMYSNIFEISMATLVSFVGRGLSTTHYFCYEAISSSGVVLILPGYVILCGSLELASRNLIAGSVKLVYSIIYSLFLGFGIAIGSDLYYLFDRSAQVQGSQTAGSATDYVHAQGILTFANASFPTLNGTFTLSNLTAGLVNQNDDSAALQSGSVYCYRDPSWQWWRQDVSPYWAFLLVPLFSTALSLWNLQPIKDRQFPIMVSIAVLGWLTNWLANIYIFNRSDIVSFIGSFVIGICGNLYSRIWKGTAFTAMVTGVLFLVPSGIAAAGGLAITQDSSSGDSYSNGLLIGFRMIQVAIGITVGLFFASFLIYSFFSGRKRSAALFAF